MQLRFGETTINWVPQRLVIAGYTGKDQEAVKKHIEELKELGVPAPPKVPMLYDLSPELLQAAETITAVKNESSGEAEVVLFDIDGTWYVGLGSDHTDRVLEAVSVQKSKQVCAKPVAAEVWKLSEVADHWDKIEMKSWVQVNGEERLYQSGTLQEFLNPKELLEIVAREGYASPGMALFCGTLALIDGEFRYGAPFRAELHDPVLQKTLRLCYQVQQLKDAEEV